MPTRTSSTQKPTTTTDQQLLDFAALPAQRKALSDAITAAKAAQSTQYRLTA